MAQAPHALNVPGQYPMLRVFEYEKGKSIGLADQIKDALSMGIAVLVHGWEPEDAMEFSVHDIGAYRPPIWQDVTWQGM